MPATATAFFRAAVTYSLLGLMLGLHMAATHDHAQHVTHAHIMLIGWVSMFLYGAYLKLHPGAGGALVPVLWWLANVGLVILVGGLLVIYGGNPAGGEIYATIGSFIVFGGFALFAFMVWRSAE